MAPTGDNVSAGPNSSTAVPELYSKVAAALTARQCSDWLSRSSEAEHRPLLVPVERQTRARQQLVGSQIARLAPVEDRLDDVRGEIAEADEPREIGWAHALALGQCGKRHTVAVDECGIEPARSDQQLDQPRIGFGGGKWVGPVDQHLDLPPGAPQLYRHREVWASSVALDNDVAAISSSMPSRVGRRWMSIRLARTSMRSIRAERNVRCRAAGKSGQLLPISPARVISRRC